MRRSVIGLFGRVMNNNELCSDWLFHSAAQCWALLWLAVSQCCSMLSSALIGCFTVLLNVELCSDWLFHSAAHKQKGNTEENIFKYFLSQLYLRVIILYIKHGHRGAFINTWGIETGFERSVDRIIVSFSRYAIARTLFILWSGSTYHTFHKIRRLSVVLRICKPFVIILISPYSVYVVSEILCTVMQQATANKELTMSI